MALLNAPPIRDALTDKEGKATPAFGNWLMQVFRGTPFYGSGITANRPSLSDLKVGGYYFDTSLGALGKPIYVNKTATGWVTADGVAA